MIWTDWLLAGYLAMGASIVIRLRARGRLALLMLVAWLPVLVLMLALGLVMRDDDHE